MVERLEAYLSKERPIKLAKKEKGMEAAKQHEEANNVLKRKMTQAAEDSDKDKEEEEIGTTVEEQVQINNAESAANGEVEYENNVKPKLVYNAADKSNEPSKKEMAEIFEKRRFMIQVFDQEEMDLIACAFKSQLSEIRKAIKATDILMKKNKFEMKKETLDQYKMGLKKDLKDKSLHLITIIQRDCIEVTGSPIGLIFFKKLQADIYRYMAMHHVGIDQKEKMEIKELCHRAYKEATYMLKMLRIQRESQNETDMIDSLRLSLNLNYACFLYEVDQKKKKAIRILKGQIQEALDDFDKWDPNQIE